MYFYLLQNTLNMHMFNSYCFSFLSAFNSYVSFISTQFFAHSMQINRCSNEIMALDMWNFLSGNLEKLSFIIILRLKYCENIFFLLEWKQHISLNFMA